MAEAHRDGAGRSDHECGKSRVLLRRVVHYDILVMANL